MIGPLSSIGGKTMRVRPIFAAAGGLALVGAGYLWRKAARRDPLQVNDIHSQLNLTRVDQLVTPDGVEALQSAIQAAAIERKAVCVAGGRHAMGGQQFAREAVLVDTRKLNRMLKLDAEK